MILTESRSGEQDAMSASVVMVSFNQSDKLFHCGSTIVGVRARDSDMEKVSSWCLHFFAISYVDR